MPEPTQENTENAQVCAHDPCENTVTEDDYCHGCNCYVCNEHSIADPWGSHNPEDHWDVCPECGQGSFDCTCGDDDDDTSQRLRV